MRVALLSLRLYLNMKFENFLFSRLFWKEAIALPPIGLAYIASALEKDSHRVIIVDGARYNYNNDEYVRILKEFSPDIIGISVNSFSFQDFLHLARAIKNEIPVPIVVGGSHVSLFPGEMLRVKTVDFAIYGDGELPMRELVSALDHGGDIGSIRNLVYRDEAGVTHMNGARNPIALDHLDFPAYHLINLDDYTYYFNEQERFVVMFIGRGCPYRCNFCVNKPSKFRLRSVENVITEIKLYYFEHGIKVIHFYDDCFTFNKEWVLEFTEALRQNHISIRWTCLTRVDCVDKELLNRMAKTGCFLIRYGIESGDPGMLRIMNKRVSLRGIETAIKLTNQAGIRTFGFFMIGVPGETKESVKNTLRFILNSSLDYVRPIRFIAMPKVRFYDDYLKQGNHDFWSDYLNARSTKLDGVLHDVGFSERQLNRLVKKMFLRFYLHPRRALSLFKRERRSLPQVWVLIKSLLAVLMYFL